jgi:hypothetical protein
VVEEGVQQANLQLASVENVHSALEDGRQQVSMEVDVLNGGQTGNDHVGQGEVLVNKGTEAFEAGALAPSGDQVGSQDGKIHAEGGLDGYSDVGSLNWEEEHELEEYFKKIEEENMRGERGRGGKQSAWRAAE